MNKRVLYALLPLLVLFMSGCSLNRIYRTPYVRVQSSLSSYRYAYILPTDSYMSSSISTEVDDDEITERHSSEEVVPSSIIAASLMKHGLVVVDNPNEVNRSKLLVVRFAESAPSESDMFSNVETTVQMIDATNDKIVAVVAANGYGRDKALAVRNGISRGLAALFNSPEK